MYLSQIIQHIKNNHEFYKITTNKVITRAYCTLIKITSIIIQQLKQQLIQDDMPSGLHFKLYYNLELHYDNTFIGVEDLQNEEDNMFIGVENNDENVLNIYDDIPDLNDIQDTMYMPSEFHIPNFDHQNKALNESEINLDLSRMPDNIYEEIDEDELSKINEDEQSNNNYEDKDKITQAENHEFSSEMYKSVLCDDDMVRDLFQNPEE